MDVKTLTDADIGGMPPGPFMGNSTDEILAVFLTETERRLGVLRGLPTIEVRDMVIQKRASDLVLATFGRGFYVLDDYSPLRTATPETLKEEAVLFPVRTALEYVQASPLEEWHQYLPGLSS